jgi:hypothetical protein
MSNNLKLGRRDIFVSFFLKFLEVLFSTLYGSWGQGRCNTIRREKRSDGAPEPDGALNF